MDCFALDKVKRGDIIQPMKRAAFARYQKTLRSIFAYIKKNVVIVLSFLFLIILADTLYTPTSSDIKMFGILILYGVVSKFYGLTSRLTLGVCLSLFGIMFFQFLVSGPAVQTEKTAVWLILFWAFSMVQQWRELKSESHE